MNKELKKVYQDILNDNLPEVNIPRFFNSLVNEYHTFAMVRLAMHYYTCYETLCEEKIRWSDTPAGILNQLNGIIENDIVTAQTGSELEKAVSQTDKLRNEIMHRMRLLTSYTDIFQIYEYVINRIEYRFKEVNGFVDNDEFSREILRYIFDSKDNVIINDKIREIVGQLPVRMTKQRYFDLLKGSIREYIGAGKDTLDTYLYMLRTSAMLDHEEDMDKLFPGLWEKKVYLEQLQFKDITEPDFKKAQSILKEAAAEIDAETTAYYSLQEIVNEVYALLLCTPYYGMETLFNANQEEAAFSVIKGISEEFAAGSKKNPPDELIGKIQSIEGVQEELSFDLTVLEEALYKVDKDYRKLTESIMADKMLNALLLCRDLLSGSLFIDFYEIKNSQNVDEKTAEEESDKLTEELSKLFTDHDRMVCRAVMANTLDKMPVFFKSHKEVMDYVRYCVENCSDLPERTACAEIIKGIMSA